MKMVLNMKKAVAVLAASFAVNALAQTQVSTTATSDLDASLSKFTGSFLYLGHFGVTNVSKNTGARTDEYQYRLGYKITDKTKVGILGAFVYDRVAKNSTDPQGDVEFYDSAITATTTAGSLLGSDPVALDFRLYVPTSRSAAYKNGLENRQAKVRIDASLNFPINGKLAAGVLLSPRHTIINNAPNRTQLISVASLTYNFTDAVSTYAAVNDEYAVAHAAAKAEEITHKIGPEIGVNYTAHKNLDVSLIMTQERDVLAPSASSTARSTYALFYDKETEYQLQGVMHF